MNRPLRFALLTLQALALLSLTSVPVADARITRLVVTRVESPTFGGASFGAAGQFEKVIGIAYGEVDPSHPLNAIIQDIELAPRNIRGMVEYDTDFYVIKPVRMEQGNRMLFYNVVNRGNKGGLGTFSYMPTHDPLTGQTNGILERCLETDTCPKIFHVATALEIWEGRQSLGLTDPLGRHDLGEPAFIRTTTVLAPLGTYTGWNLGRADRWPNHLCSLSGSFIPFARTRAARLAAGDPRLSLEERYGSQAGYVRAVGRGAERLRHMRLLLEEDADRLIQEAKVRDLGLPPGDPQNGGEGEGDRDD